MIHKVVVNRMAKNLLCHCKSKIIPMTIALAVDIHQHPFWSLHIQLQV